MPIVEDAALQPAPIKSDNIRGGYHRQYSPWPSTDYWMSTVWLLATAAGGVNATVVATTLDDQSLANCWSNWLRSFRGLVRLPPPLPPPPPPPPSPPPPVETPTLCLYRKLNCYTFAANPSCVVCSGLLILTWFAVVSKCLHDAYQLFLLLNLSFVIQSFEFGRSLLLSDSLCSFW